jgi:hypothetical protein
MTDAHADSAVRSVAVTLARAYGRSLTPDDDRAAGAVVAVLAEQGLLRTDCAIAAERAATCRYLAEQRLGELDPWSTTAAVQVWLVGLAAEYDVQVQASVSGTKVARKAVPA